MHLELSLHPVDRALAVQGRHYAGIADQHVEVLPSIVEGGDELAN